MSHSQGKQWAWPLTMVFFFFLYVKKFFFEKATSYKKDEAARKICLSISEAHSIAFGKNFGPLSEFPI